MFTNFLATNNIYMTEQTKNKNITDFSLDGLTEYKGMVAI